MILDYKENCIIGFSGFIGQNLCNKINFKYLINSQNLESIKYKDIDLIICAAPSATKWMINADGTEDIKNINNIIDTIKTINVKKIILLSSIDVFGFEISNGFNEITLPNIFNNHNYGINRIFFEKELKNIFKEKLLILRLSGLFGPFLKKNLLFDIKNNKYNMLQSINYESSYQWYNIDNLYNDINYYINNDLVHLVNEPIKNYEIINLLNGKIDIKNNKNSNIINYNITTKYTEGLYLKNKLENLIEIKSYLNI